MNEKIDSLGGIDFFPFSATEEHQILELLNISWGKKFSANHFNWQYKQNPTGDSTKYAVLAKKDNLLVGFICPILLSYKISKSFAVIYQSTNYVIHPDFRNNYSLSKNLFSIALEMVRNENLNVGIFYPQKIGYFMAKKLMRFKDGIQIIHLQRILNIKFIPTKLCSLDLTIRSILQFKKQDIQNILNPNKNELDQFWNSIEGNYETIMIRNADYFVWKYFTHQRDSNKVYVFKIGSEIKGIAVLKIRNAGDRKYGELMECLALNQKVYKRLLLHVLVQATNHNLFKITTNINLKDRNLGIYNDFLFFSKTKLMRMLKCIVPNRLQIFMSRKLFENEDDRFPIYKNDSSIYNDTLFENGALWHFSNGDLEFG